MTMTTDTKNTCAHCGGPVVDGACEDCGRVPVGKDLLGSGPVAPRPVADSPTVSRRTRTRNIVSSTVKITVATQAKAAPRVAGTRGSSSRRRALGGGLISLPSQPNLDPLKMVMTIDLPPVTCTQCGKTSLGGKKFCGSCGADLPPPPKNLENGKPVPNLFKGALISGQYRIEGPIAAGGLGWIYLARDTFLNRFVVLKGLLNTDDEEAIAAALAERQFLAAVKHPKIVQVFNFVKQGDDGYIVMEYVGGKMMKTIRQERGPLPVSEAIAYILGILPAFTYLHEQGYVYCDFKPHNFMLEGDDVKLIDLGAVRKIGDPAGSIYATPGYSAPEADDDPVAVSDLYSIGRTLAQLIMDFRMADQDNKELPWPDDAKVLQDNESLKLFLERACAKDPALRFQSADEMFDQLYGVLREVVSLDMDEPKPAVSDLFLGDGLIDGHDEAEIWAPSAASLPRLRPNPADSASGAIIAAGNLKGEKLAGYLNSLATQFPKSKELRYARADALISEGSYDAATRIINEFLAADPYDWKAWFQQGRITFLQGAFRYAAGHFARIRAELPGEPAAQLALALSLEALRESEAAEVIYDRVSRADPSYASAAFGLARCRIAAGDRAGAVAAFKRIPATSALNTTAKIAAITILINKLEASGKTMHPLTSDLVEASEIFADLGVQTKDTELLASDLLTRAAEFVESGAAFDSNTHILHHAPKIATLRKGAEASLRKAARLCDDPKIAAILVDRANRVRPTTLF